jgi:hypothetical protein
MATLEERIETAERIFVTMMEAAVDTIEMTHTRLLALQSVLEARGILVDAEVAAKMQTLRDAATLEVEYGDDPLSEQFRKMRRQLKRRRRRTPGGQ